MNYIKLLRDTIDNNIAKINSYFAYFLYDVTKLKNTIYIDLCELSKLYYKESDITNAILTLYESMNYTDDHNESYKLICDISKNVDDYIKYYNYLAYSNTPDKYTKMRILSTQIQNMANDVNISFRYNVLDLVIKQLNTLFILNG